MALIQFQIDRDSSGNITITSTIQRLVPGDEISLVTATAGAALQWSTNSPFAPPAAGKLYVLPQAGAGSAALQVTKPIDMSTAVAECGLSDSAGNFTPWGKEGAAGFPGGGGTNKATSTADD